MTAFEHFMLSLAVPSLGLPELIEPSEEELRERADAVGYGDLAPHSEGNLRALLMLLGVLPATQEERMNCIQNAQ